MKKINYVIETIFVLAFVLVLTGCTNKTSKEFKNDYESINGKIVREGSDSKFREVTISNKNVFEHIDSKEIVKKIENKETFYLYVGDKKCPWCRSVIEKATEVSINKKVSKIYYINIWDDEFNEIFRDKYTADSEGNLTKVSEGTDEYKKLLEYFDSVLEDYTITLEDGSKISTGEKRIYAPNFFYVSKGEVKMMVTGNSDKQTGAYDELTEEILKDEEDIFNKFFNLGDSCSLDSGC